MNMQILRSRRQLAAARAGGRAGRRPARSRRPRSSSSRCSSTAPAPTRRTACRGPTASGLPQDDQRARRRRERRQAHLRGMRDRLRHRPRRRVLRAPEGQDAGATVFEPLSTGITFALTDKVPGDKIPLHHGRATASSTAQDGNVVQVELPARGHATGPRADILIQHLAKKEGGLASSRARRSRSSTTTRRTARSRSRCCRSARRCTASSCS